MALQNSAQNDEFKFLNLIHSIRPGLILPNFFPSLSALESIAEFFSCENLWSSLYGSRDCQMGWVSAILEK